MEIRWYGLILAAAVLASTGALARLLKLQGASHPWDEASALAAWLLPAGLLGARLAFAVQNLPTYLASPARIIAFWDGGLSIHGALLGGLGAVALREASRARFRSRADMLFTVLPLGQSIGRWGNLLNRELLGAPTHLPWGLYVEPAYRPAALAATERFHPVFLYESLACLALFALLWRRIVPRGRRPGSRTSARPGSQMALYLMGYALIRFGIEFIRLGDPALLGLTLAQWASLVLLGAGWAGWRRWGRPEGLAGLRP